MFKAYKRSAAIRKTIQEYLARALCNPKNRNAWLLQLNLGSSQVKTKSKEQPKQKQKKK